MVFAADRQDDPGRCGTVPEAFTVKPATRRMWASVTQRSDAAAPSSRTKHSATLLGGHLYVLGGRNGNLPLKDLWRYHLAENRWEELKPSGDCPPCLQEHTAVAYKDHLYVFGGELGFSACNETPLWIYSVKSNSWRKAGGQRGAAAPRGRRGHSALVYRGSMLVYGGYRDLRGSSNELWAFHFETESWHILSSGVTVSKSDSIPPARHKHSAVIHDDTMWVYGGMTDLNERQDLWRIDLHRKRWHCVRTRQGPRPGPLHSHAACKLPGCMLVFGGERDGQPSAELWRFHFALEAWERVHVEGPKPSARAEAVALAVSELLLEGSPRSPAPAPEQLARPRARAGGSMDRAPRHPLHNRVSPCERKYVFKPNPHNYVDGSCRDEFTDRRNRKNGYQQSNGLVPQHSNLGFLKEISKLSQINLSRLAHHKCSYSVLNAEEGEGAAPGPHSAPPATSAAADPPSKLVKSQSANLLSKRAAARPTLTTAPRRRPIPRDNASVPNFTTLASSLPTPVLTPVEAARLVFLDSDQEEEELSPRGEYIRPASPGGPPAKDFGSLHQQCRPGRSDSYTSHLGHAAELQQRHEEQHKQQRTIPKSASVRFQPHLEEVSDENISNTSDYASIETVNRISSASNSSVSNRPSPVDSGGGKYRGSGKKTPVKEGPISFCNPNYMGPDVAAILNGGGSGPAPGAALASARRSWHGASAGAAARMLNSPPDSLLEDPSGRSESQEDVELRQLDSPPRRAPAPPQSLALRCTAYPSCAARNKSRASSASRVERALEQPEEAPPPKPAAVYMFVVGGKEHGQVTVFRRPLSVWKLLLHHYAH